MYKLSDLIKTTQNEANSQCESGSKEELGLEDSIYILSDMAYSYIDESPTLISKANTTS